MGQYNFENAPSALLYAEQGQKYQAEGNYEAAVKAYAESIRLFPSKENVGTYYNLGVCYYKLKDHRQAIYNFTQALQINPDYLDAYYNRGTSRSILEDYKGAIEDYTQVISRNPDDANAYELRGGCYFKSNNFQEATSDIQRAAELYLSQGNLPRYQRIMALPGIGSPSKNINSSNDNSNITEEKTENNSNSREENRLTFSSNVSLAIGVLATILSGWNFVTGIMVYLVSCFLLYIIAGFSGK